MALAVEVLRERGGCGLWWRLLSMRRERREREKGGHQRGKRKEGTTDENGGKTAEVNVG